MNKGLDELKEDVRVYQRQQNSLLRGLPIDNRPTKEEEDSLNYQVKKPLLQKIEKKLFQLESM